MKSSPVPPPEARAQTRTSRGGRKRTRALLLAAGVPLRPGQPVRCAEAEVLDDPEAAFEAQLQIHVRERGPDGRATSRAICAALTLSCGCQEGAARMLGMDDSTLSRRIKADEDAQRARRAGAKEGKRLFDRSLYAALRAGDTGAMALWARYYGHRVGVVAEGSTAGSGGGQDGGGEPRVIDLGREVRSILEVTDEELLALIRRDGPLKPEELASMIAGLSPACRQCLEDNRISRGSTGASGEQQAGIQAGQKETTL